MSDDIKDLISMYENLQNEYICLFEKNNIDVAEINKCKEDQKSKLLSFKIKLLEYKSIPYKSDNKKVFNEWDLNLTK
jgi:hypothetical protein